MVVAIVGLILAMGMPSFLSARREAPLTKAVNDVKEICDRARAYAILHDETTTVTFHPLTKEISTSSADTSQSLARAGRTPVTSTQLDGVVEIADLSINLGDYGATENPPPVRFFSNGTSDELRIVLFSDGEYRRISLEPITALAHSEVIQ